MPLRPIEQPTDTCARCGLRLATREMEEKGIVIDLCEECYWGKEFQAPPRSPEKEQTAS